MRVSCFSSQNQASTTRKITGVLEAGFNIQIGVASRGVAGRLAVHGAGGASQHPRHRPERVAVGQAQAQGFRFFGTHVSVGSRSHGNTVAHPGLKCGTWS